jgi:hypothetical protein
MYNHQRYCTYNPNKLISRCPVCKIEVKPGSMIYHKRKAHGYSPNKRDSMIATKSE